MALPVTDFYLNLDRWEGLGTVERQRGIWEARRDAPAARLEAIRVDAMLEAGWLLYQTTTHPDPRARQQILAPIPPSGKYQNLTPIWRYGRTVQLVNGWYAAFAWTPQAFDQLFRVLRDPDKRDPSADAALAEQLIALHHDAEAVSRQIRGGPLVQAAAFYGGLRSLERDMPEALPLCTLTYRMIALQQGYLQVLYAPIEGAWRSRGLAQRPRGAAGAAAMAEEPPVEERLGRWLDESTELMLDVGRRAEEIWTRIQSLSSRSPLQETILSLAVRHGRVTAGEVLKATKANRNTVKDNLGRLVEEGMLQKLGRKRGTIYLPI